MVDLKERALFGIFKRESLSLELRYDRFGPLCFALARALHPLLEGLGHLLLLRRSPLRLCLELRSQRFVFRSQG